MDEEGIKKKGGKQNLQYHLQQISETMVKNQTFLVQKPSEGSKKRSKVCEGQIQKIEASEDQIDLIEILPLN